MNNDTFCPILWDSLLIDPDGSIFSCCHCKPGLLGNIYQNKLSDVYNNETIQKFRKDSLAGTLHCYPTCILLDKTKHYNTEVSIGNYSKLMVRFGSKCHIHCIMCYYDRNGPTLSFERMKPNLELSPFKHIDITGGEPLFIQDAKAFFDYAASLGKKVSLMSNGLLIDDEWAEKIARHSAFIYISLNAATKETHELVNKGSHWEKVMVNVQRLRDAKVRLGTNVMIHGHMTIVIENLHEVADFIRRFPQFGFENISFGFDYHVPPYLREHPEIMQKVSKEVTSAVGQCSDPSLIDANRLKQLHFLH